MDNLDELFGRLYNFRLRQAHDVAIKIEGFPKKVLAILEGLAIVT